MAILSYKPINASRRFMTRYVKEVTKEKPEKKLTIPLRKKGGRNFQGVITVRHRGGGHKRRVRIVDFKRDKNDIPAKVIAIEYDPNRSALLALLEYEDGERRYIIQPEGLKVGKRVVSSWDKIDVRVGNCMPLEHMPLGTVIHNIELVPGRGAKIARSAGAYAQLMAIEGKYAILKLPSGEMRKVLKNCRATVGQVGNVEYENIDIGSAGRMRRLGRRPHVRGVAMNPVDHPHGGGKGKQKGYKQPVSPTGIPAKGYKTRKRNKPSSKLIIKRRR
ncbi:MAG: 50S ribosomal protein L2 [Caldiserica bacterium]|nr:MAG: 50S ribosomal protein L2 [Caldisericota bacterium]